MNILKQSALKLWFKFKKPGVVFYGHNVTEHTGPKLIPSLHLQPNEFEDTIIQFKGLGFEFIDMERLILLSRSGFRNNRPWLHITFDDGYQDNLDVILPIVIKHQIPITVFVSTDHIENRKRFYTYRIKQAILYTSRQFEHKQWSLSSGANEADRLKFYRAVVDDFKLMTVEEALEFMSRIDELLQLEIRKDLDTKLSCDEVMDEGGLRQLAESRFITIGSHNHQHVIMNINVPDHEMEHQMKASKTWIESKLGSKCSSYCYPNGQSADFNHRSKSICQKHYQVAFTTLSGFVNGRTDPYEIPRMFLLPDCISIIHRLAFPEWIFQIKRRIGQIESTSG